MDFKNFEEKIKYEKMQPYFQNIQHFLKCQQQEGRTVFPPKMDILKAFRLCPLEQTKVVILGQDPYHGEGQAMGLSFSTPKCIKNPPSMQNILKEIQQEFNRPSCCLDGDLTPWAMQGVLLLNSFLTVEKAQPSSHQKIGWERFTDEMIHFVSRKKQHIVFMLWGSFAQKKEGLIDHEKGHLVLKSAHPSPFSVHRGFFGNLHFLKCNAFLERTNQAPVDW